MKRSCLFDAELEATAKQTAKTNYGTLDLWFREKFSLPATDDRYLDATDLDMLTAYWEAYYIANGGKDTFDDDEFDLATALDDLSEWDEVINNGGN